MGIMIDTKAFIVDGNESDSEQRNEEEKVGLYYEDIFIKRSKGVLSTVEIFEKKLRDFSFETQTIEDIKVLLENSAKDLWVNAKEYVQSGTYDDRPLYWARIKMEVALKNHLKGKLDADIENLIQLFEEKSRNYTGINFTKNIDNLTIGKPKKKILITGFDPFGLKYNEYPNIQQSNPSGAVALALHGTEISDEDGHVGEIQAMIFPVRYEDFDKGYVEKYIYPHLHNVDMIVTISQGRMSYDIERFAGSFRGKNHNDNRNKKGNSVNYYQIINLSQEEFVLTPISDVPQYLETTLPYSSMCMAKKKYDINVVYNQKLYKKNEKDINTLIQKEDVQIDDKIVGSGGDYLSNEIFYRVSLLREQYNSTLKTGHLHLPIIQYYQAPFFSLQKTRIEVENTKILLQYALKNL